MADVVFCCVGIPSFLVISSIGANPKSRVFYTRTKGEMEEAFLALRVPHTCILRPSLILGDRKERRWLEEAGAVVMQSLRFLMTGNLRNYRPIETATIASAMIQLDR